MNAQSLWAGHDYAYAYEFGRGETFRMSAERIKVVAIHKVRYPGNKRESTEVEVFKLNHDGTKKQNYKNEDIVTRVKARDIFMRWDQFESEFEARKTAADEANRIFEAQREARRLEREAEDAKRRVEAEERQRKADEQKELILSALERKGLPRNAIYFHSTTIEIRRAVLEAWLRIGVENAA